jgi:hypothetical protein
MNNSPVVLSRFASKSNPSLSHEVRRGADGVVYCTCPSWRFQKNSPSNRTCKHIEMWKGETMVGGVSLASVMGPGPVAVRAPRKPRAPKPAPVPVVVESAKSESFEEPEWDVDSKAVNAWARVLKNAG